LAVYVVERDPARALQARYDGWPVVSLEEAPPQADVVVTATGSTGVLSGRHLPFLRQGAFLVNVGHRSEEIDPRSCWQTPPGNPPLYIEEIDLGDRTVYLLPGRYGEPGSRGVATA
jgi:adenosylhomocysteinase